jgi:hypothetical protein
MKTKKPKNITPGQRPYAMLKAPVPSITVVKQHWAQSVLGWVTAYKRLNHTKDWLALLLARCCIASWGIDPDAPWRRYAWLYGTPRWVLAQTRQEACDRLETTVMRPSGTRENKQTNITPGVKKIKMIWVTFCVYLYLKILILFAYICSHYFAYKDDVISYFWKLPFVIILAIREPYLLWQDSIQNSFLNFF